ncbi:hypothetical protein GCM10022217_29620 [Chryseobacterium ginsenosidimutans]
MKKYYSRKLKLLKIKKLNLESIGKSVRRAFFPTKFENEKVKNLYQLVSENDSNTEYWYLGSLLSDFINIIKNFNQNDVEYFFKTIHFWDSYHLVVIADKLLDSNVKANVKYDFGIVYCKIFCLYEKFDSYFLIDNLEIAVTMYDSKLDLNILIDLTTKVQLLFQNEQINKQQFDYNLSFINKLQNEL